MSPAGLAGDSPYKANGVHMSGMYFPSGRKTVRNRIAEANWAGHQVGHQRSNSPVSSERLSLERIADSNVWRRNDEDAALDGILDGLESAICQLIECQGEAGPDTDRYLIRKAKRIRQMNSQCEALFGKQFQNAPMNMLIELFVCSACGEKTLVKNLCLASSVSQSTALRWINRLIALGLITRCDDEADARRSLIELTSKGRDALSRFLSTT